MIRDFYTWYAPRRGFRQLGIFLAVFALFPVLGVAAILMGEPGLGIAALAFGLFCYLLLLSGAAAWGCRYGLGERTVCLKRLTTSRILSFDEISSIAGLTHDQAAEFMNRLQHPVIEAERALNLSEWFKASRKWGEISRFVSVPIVSSVTTRGNRRNITSAKVLPVGQLLLLRLEDGQGLLISPRDPETFLKQLSYRGVTIRPFSPEDLTGQVPRIDIEKLNRSHKRWRTYMRVNLAILIPLILLFAFRIPLLERLPESLRNHPAAQWLSSLGQEPPEESITTDETANEPQEELILTPDGAFLDDNQFVFGVPLDKLSEEQKAGVSSLSLLMDFGVPGLLRILEGEGAVPVVEDPWVRNVTVSQILSNHGSLTSLDDLEWNGTLHRFYLLEMDDLKSVTITLTKGF